MSSVDKLLCLLQSASAKVCLSCQFGAPSQVLNPVRPVEKAFKSFRRKCRKSQENGIDIGSLRWHNVHKRELLSFGGNEAELITGRLSSVESIAKPT